MTANVNESQLIKAIDEVSEAANKVCDKILRDITVTVTIKDQEECIETELEAELRNGCNTLQNQEVDSTLTQHCRKQMTDLRNVINGSGIGDENGKREEDDKQRGGKAELTEDITVTAETQISMENERICNRKNALKLSKNHSIDKYLNNSNLLERKLRAWSRDGSEEWRPPVTTNSVIEEIDRILRECNADHIDWSGASTGNATAKIILETGKTKEPDNSNHCNNHTYYDLDGMLKREATMKPATKSVSPELIVPLVIQHCNGISGKPNHAQNSSYPTLSLNRQIVTTNNSNLSLDRSRSSKNLNRKNPNSEAAAPSYTALSITAISSGSTRASFSESLIPLRKSSPSNSSALSFASSSLSAQCPVSVSNVICNESHPYSSSEELALIFGVRQDTDETDEWQPSSVTSALLLHDHNSNNSNSGNNTIVELKMKLMMADTMTNRRLMRMTNGKLLHHHYCSANMNAATNNYYYVLAMINCYRDSMKNSVCHLFDLNDRSMMRQLFYYLLFLLPNRIVIMRPLLLTNLNSVTETTEMNSFIEITDDCGQLTLSNSKNSINNCDYFKLTTHFNPIYISEIEFCLTSNDPERKRLLVDVDVDVGEQEKTIMMRTVKLIPISDFQTKNEREIISKLFQNHLQLSTRSNSRFQVQHNCLTVVHLREGSSLFQMSDFITWPVLIVMERNEEDRVLYATASSPQRRRRRRHQKEGKTMEDRSLAFGVVRSDSKERGPKELNSSDTNTLLKSVDRQREEDTKEDGSLAFEDTRIDCNGRGLKDKNPSDPNKPSTSHAQAVLQLCSSKEHSMNVLGQSRPIDTEPSLAHSHHFLEHLVLISALGFITSEDYFTLFLIVIGIVVMIAIALY